jgi:hypothetical protein
VPMPGTLWVVNKISAAAASRSDLRRCRTHTANYESRKNSRRTTRRCRKKTHRNSLLAVFVYVLGKVPLFFLPLARRTDSQENSSLSFVSFCELPEPLLLSAGSAAPTTGSLSPRTRRPSDSLYLRRLCLFLVSRSDGEREIWLRYSR